MSFACDACNKTLSARAGRPTCCPWCGGPVTSRPAVEETPITLTRVKPALRRVGRNRIGPVHELLIGGAVVASLLLVLLGMGWFLVSHLRPRHDEAARAIAATTPAQDQPAPLPPAPVVALRTVPAAVGSIPLPEEPPVRKQPGEQPPVEQTPPNRLVEFPVAEARPALPQAAPQPKVDPVQPPQPQPAAPAVSASASFMGVKALGKRICIIADCSGSMAFNNRMVRLKKEMAATLKALSTDQEFYVIYFSSTAIPMPARSWRHGGKDVKKILPWIGLQPAEGATEPLPAFERAFRLSPRPDVIFFLTDGIIPAATPAQVARLNGAGKNKTPIHTILFGGELPGVTTGVVLTPVRSGRNIVMVPRRVAVPKVEKDEGQLEQIARDSGGTHRFVSDGARR